jgi:hypothetical protein
MRLPTVAHCVGAGVGAGVDGALAVGEPLGVGPVGPAVPPPQAIERQRTDTQNRILMKGDSA